MIKCDKNISLIDNSDCIRISTNNTIDGGYYLANQPWNAQCPITHPIITAIYDKNHNFTRIQAIKCCAMKPKYVIDYKQCYAVQTNDGGSNANETVMPLFFFW